MSSITSTNLGPLTTIFTPSVPTCTSIYNAQNGGADWLALAQNTGCMPSNFNREPDYFYSPGICPSGYDYACTVLPSTTNGVVGSTVATCCPSSYTCANARVTGELNEIYACYTTLASQTTLTISSTFFGASTVVGSVVTTATSGDIVFAYGIPIARANTDPAWTTTSSITPTTTSGLIPPQTTSQSVVTPGTASGTATGTAEAHKGANLTDGAKAGIGIGAALGALFLIGLGYLIFRRQKQKRATHPGGPVTESQMHGKVPGSGEGNIASYEMPSHGGAATEGKPGEMYGNVPEPWQRKTPYYEMPT